MRTYRGSSAPIAIACPASVNPDPDETLLDSLNEAATVGTVVHRICEAIVHTGEVPRNWHQIAAVYGITGAKLGEVGSLIYAAKAFWDEYGHAFANPQTELALEQDIPGRDEWVTLSCHIDIADIQIDEAIVLDWKTTRLDIDYSAQLLFYAWIPCLLNPNIQKVTSMQVFLRDRTANIQVWTRQQIDDFAARYVNEVINWDGRTYRPGAHCGYCRRWANCPAQSTMIVQTHKDLIETEIHLPVEPDALINLYERVGALGKRIEQFRTAVKARVDHEGVIQGAAKRLAFVDQSRDEIDARKGWGILKRELTEDELADCLAVTKGTFLDYVKEHAPQGQKGKAKKAIMEELRNAGAVTSKEIRALRLLQGQAKEIGIHE